MSCDRSYLLRKFRRVVDGRPAWVRGEAARVGKRNETSWEYEQTVHMTVVKTQERRCKKDNVWGNEVDGELNRDLFYWQKSSDHFLDRNIDIINLYEAKYRAPERWLIYWTNGL